MNLKQMTKIKDKETMIKELADLLALLPDEEVARMVSVYQYMVFEIGCIESKYRNGSRDINRHAWYLKSIV